MDHASFGKLLNRMTGAICEQDADAAAARGLRDGEWAIVYNARGRFRARVHLSGAVRPGVAVATGIYWRKHVHGAANANATTPSALTDMGGGATFFDNLVEVRAGVGDETAGPA